MITSTEAVFHVSGNKRTKEVATTLDIKPVIDFPISYALSMMIPLLFEHQISAHKNLRNLIVDALQDNVYAYFEGAPVSPRIPRKRWKNFGSLTVRLQGTDAHDPRFAVQVHVRGNKFSPEVISGFVLNHAVPLGLMYVTGEAQIHMMLYLLYGLVVWQEEGLQFPLRDHTWFFAVNGPEVTTWQMMQRALRAKWLPESIRNAIMGMMIRYAGAEDLVNKMIDAKERFDKANS